jgi:hypothetical protein
MSNDKVPVLAQDVRALKSETPLFDLGQCVATPRALEHLLKHNIFPLALLARHAHGDWGDVGAEDVQSNEDALQSGARIFSVYVIAGTKLYLITDAADDDGARPASSILLSVEY